jgi:hypothetical protein
LHVELDGSCQHVGDERRADAEPAVTAVDGEPAEQESGRRVRRLFGNGWRCGRTVDPGHGDVG